MHEHCANVSQNEPEALLLECFSPATVCCNDSVLVCVFDGHMERDSRGTPQPRLPVGIIVTKGTVQASAKRIVVCLCLGYRVQTEVEMTD